MNTDVGCRTVMGWERHTFTRPFAACLLSCCAMLCSPGLGLAQQHLDEVDQEDEIICDPENPACSQLADPPRHGNGEGEVPAGEEEIICDPENPSCSSLEPRDPTPRYELRQPTSSRDEQASRTRLSAPWLEWGTSLAVDTRWSDGGEDHIEVGSGLDAIWGHDLDLSNRVELRAQLRHWIGVRRGFFTKDREDVDTRAQIDLRLGESYWRRRWDVLSVRAGMLQTRWGSATLVKPGQVIQPRDQRVFGFTGPATSDGQLAHPAVEVAWSRPGKSSFELLWVPFFLPDQNVLFGRDVALLQPNSSLYQSFPIVPLLEQLISPSGWDQAQTLANATSYPDEDLTTSSLGARWTRTIWNTDLGVGYYFGWDRTPRLQVDENVAELATIVLTDSQFQQDFDFFSLALRNPRVIALGDAITASQQRGEELFVTEYRRRQTLLLDFARYVGPVGVRGEAALSPAQYFLTESLGTVRRPSAFGSLGLSYERILGQEGVLGLVLEGFALRPFGHDQEVTRFFVKDEEERGTGEEHILMIGELLYGVAFGATVSLPEWRLELRGGGVYNLSTRDVITQASVRRRLRLERERELAVTCGAMIYEGPDPAERFTLGGLYDGNDQVFMGLDGRF